jgi:CheY-like chemotaxis protein
MYTPSNLCFASKSGNFPPNDFLGAEDPPESSGRVVRKVLVVDDEHDLAALQSDDAIDAVFSDIMMPAMTGLELADAVKVMYPEVKIVLSSGYTKSALFEGPDRPYLFAAKPYRVSAIVELLQS